MIKYGVIFNKKLYFEKNLFLIQSSIKYIAIQYL